MLYYAIHPKSPYVPQKIQEKYPFLMDSGLSHESQAVRYYLLEYLTTTYGYRGILEKDKYGKPIPILIPFHQSFPVLFREKVPKLLLWLYHFGIYFRFIFGNLKKYQTFQISSKISSIDAQNATNKEAKILQKELKNKVKKQKINHEILLYWSISHSQNHLAFIVSDIPTGIDIAEYEERDTSLLDIHSQSEYDQLSGKSWINFYTFWTAKECIIKRNGGQLDDMRLIQFISKESEGILIFAFRQETYRIQLLLTDELFIAHIL